MQVRYLKNTDIDRRLWDKTIRGSMPGLPYGYCRYLDIVSPGWNALVINNYESVMPLTWKRKYGIHYLYQPWFTQQLGIFGPDICNGETVGYFLKNIPKKYRLVDIKLNEYNLTDTGQYNFRTRSNYILSLDEGYDKIYKGFSRNCKRNIIKARTSGLRVIPGRDPGQFATFVSKHLSTEVNSFDSKASDILFKLCTAALSEGTGEIYNVIDMKGIVTASGFFLKGDKRLIFQVCASSPDGKTSQAMAYLLDHVISVYAGSGLILDFSGSMMPGVAYFNESFGAKPVEYKAVYLNRLPKIISWLK